VRTEEAIGDLARAADELTGTARVRACSAHVQALDGYYGLLEKAGRVPTDRNRMPVEQDVEQTIETILDVFRRHDVPVEAQREISDILDGRGRPLEAG
jgi:hypothetical protein